MALLGQPFTEMLRHIHSTAQQICVEDTCPVNDTVESSLLLDIDCYLPSPPTIDDALKALGTSPALFSTLSRTYEHFALQLKNASETQLRRTILACTMTNLRFGLTNYDPRPLRAAVVSVYLRILQRMSSAAIALVQRSKCTSAGPRSPSINYYPSVAEPLPCVSNQRKLHERAFFRPNSLHPLAAGLPSDVKSKSMPQRNASRHTVSPSPPVERYGRLLPCSRQFSLDEIINNEYNNRPASAFPIPYTHSRSHAFCDLPSSSHDFFPTRILKRESNLQTVAMANPVHVIESFETLSLDPSRRRITAGDSGSPRSRLVPAISTTFPQDCGSTPTAGNISLQSPRAISSQVSPGQTTQVERTSRRRVAPMPKRTQPSTFAPAAAHPHDFFAPTLSLPVISPDHQRPSSNPCPSGTSLSVPDAESSGSTRRRKLAPLPRRQPAATARSQIPVSQPSSDQSKASLLSISTLTLSFPALSRTPSLVSVASSRREDDSPSDDDLDTPPTTPPPAMTSFSSISTVSLFDDTSPSPFSRHFGCSQMEGVPLQRDDRFQQLVPKAEVPVYHLAC